MLDPIQPRDRKHYTMGLSQREKSDRRKIQNRQAAYRARKRAQFLNSLAVQLNAENVALIFRVVRSARRIPKWVVEKDLSRVPGAGSDISGIGIGDRGDAA